MCGTKAASVQRYARPFLASPPDGGCALVRQDNCRDVFREGLLVYRDEVQCLTHNTRKSSTLGARGRTQILGSHPLTAVMKRTVKRSISSAQSGSMESWPSQILTSGTAVSVR